MIKRIINGIELNINENKANEIYFPDDFVSNLNDNSISSILNAIYEKKKKIIPLTVLIELTNNCNFKCPFCYIVGKSKYFKYKSFNDLKPIFDSLIKNGMLFCTLTGGECLLHPDFKKIYFYLKKNGVLVSILTNGSLLDKTIINLFTKYKPYKIEISIYGDNDHFNTNTKQKKYSINDIKKNILLLKNNNINIICKTPLNSITENSFIKIMNWCHENNIPYYYSSELFNSYDGSNNIQYKLKNKELIKLIEQENNELLKQVNYTYGKKNLFDCKAGKYDMIITYDFNLLPCFSMKNNLFFNTSLENGFDSAYKIYKEKINQFIGKPIKYCKGCKAFNICTECAATALTKHNCNICKKNNLIRKKIIGELKDEKIRNKKIRN